MSNQKENRVLNRMGARELSQAETESVSGAYLIRPICSFNPLTCAVDQNPTQPGPCIPPPPACPN